MNNEVEIQNNQFFAVASLTMTAGLVSAQDGKAGSSALLSAANGDIAVQNPQTTPAPQGIQVGCQSFEGLESRDELGNPINIVIELDIGAGNELTGVGWDIGLETLGGSWLSEATILHSDSTGGDDMNGINLSVGAGLDEAGDQDFTSDGMILDFADNGLPNPTAGADGILRLELFDSFVDNAGAADALYRNAAEPQLCAGLALACSDQAACNDALGIGGPGPGPGIPESQPVPVNSPWALAMLIMLLAGLGLFAVRRSI